MDRGAALLQGFGQRQWRGARAVQGKWMGCRWLWAPLLVLAAMLTLPASAEAPGPRSGSTRAAEPTPLMRTASDHLDPLLLVQYSRYRQLPDQSSSGEAPSTPTAGRADLPFRGINEQIFNLP